MSEGNYIVDGDNGASNRSPYHNSTIDKECYWCGGRDDDFAFWVVYFSEMRICDLETKQEAEPCTNCLEEMELNIYQE